MVSNSKHLPDVLQRNRQRLHDRAELGDLRLPGGVLEIRQALGITQIEFARITGTTVRQIAEIETGKANPTIESLAKIGALFGWEVGFVPRKPRTGDTRMPEVHALLAQFDIAEG